MGGVRGDRYGPGCQAAWYYETLAAWYLEGRREHVTQILRGSCVTRRRSGRASGSGKPAGPAAHHGEAAGGATGGVPLGYKLGSAHHRPLDTTRLGSCAAWVTTPRIVAEGGGPAPAQDP